MSRAHAAHRWAWYPVRGTPVQQGLSATFNPRHLTTINIRESSLDDSFWMAWAPANSTSAQLVAIQINPKINKQGTLPDSKWIVELVSDVFAVAANADWTIPGSLLVSLGYILHCSRLYLHFTPLNKSSKGRRVFMASGSNNASFIRVISAFRVC